MRKYFLLLALPVAVFFVSGCNPFSYFMIYEYSSSEKPDTVADERMTELEQAREQRMALNPNYREAEIEAYRRSRGISAPTQHVDTRPVSTEELRARLEKQAVERKK